MEGQLSSVSEKMGEQNTVISVFVQHKNAPISPSGSWEHKLERFWAFICTQKKTLDN